MSTSAVELTITESIATLTLSDVARKNAMTVELGDALAARVSELSKHPQVRAVVLTGAGGAFSAGGDLKMLENLRTVPFEEARKHMLAFYGRYLSILDVKVPTIAAIEGPAIGAGLCVALACDLVLCAEDSKLAVNFVQLGLHPGMGATYFVPRRVGAERGAELLMTGRRFDGKEAKAMGLVLDAVAPGTVLSKAQELAARIATGAPLSLKALKANVGVDRAALRRALENEALAQAESYGSEDLGEGLKATVERRAARFTGS
jgi:enoyl-CoA hydratase